MRLGLKIISGDFEEDLTKIVGVEAFQRFLRKAQISENLYNSSTTAAQVDISKICSDITSLPVWRLFC